MGGNRGGEEPRLGCVGRNRAAVLINLLSCLLLVKTSSVTTAPASKQGFCCSALCVAELRDRNKEELGRERGVLGVETPRWGLVRHLTGIWKARGLLICRQSAGRAGPRCLPQPRAPAEAPSSRAAKQIIVISLPRLNQCVIKSGSVLPWDFFSGRNRKLKKPQNLIR